jgi:hypothetical protein
MLALRGHYDSRLFSNVSMRPIDMLVFDAICSAYGCLIARLRPSVLGILALGRCLVVRFRPGVFASALGLLGVLLTSNIRIRFSISPCFCFSSCVSRTCDRHARSLDLLFARPVSALRVSRNRNFTIAAVAVHLQHAHMRTQSRISAVTYLFDPIPVARLKQNLSGVLLLRFSVLVHG